jgi:hypothetical protein
MKVARRPPTTMYAVTMAGRIQYAAQIFIPVREEKTAQPPAARALPLMRLVTRPKKV